ncbi:MAG: bifunctional riboflavin kinase/FAD synthetase [Candidatus Zixiibacteriota bacterium]
MKNRFVRGLANLGPRPESGAVVTIGTFDGIHRGHQAIFARVREAGKVTGLESILVTFDPHPRVVVQPERPPRLLTTIEEKEQFIPCFFEGRVLVLAFDQVLMNKSAEQFVKEVLIAGIGVRRLIVGYDHAFGKNRTGNPAELKRLGQEYGFEVEVVEPVMVAGMAVSSSRIRKAFDSGRFDEAVRLLGHDYAIYGTVERGIGLGRKLGYPTANVHHGAAKLLPTEGVYACRVQVEGEEFKGMMFIGRNHFNPAGRITVEANIFDFDRDIYDEEITVYPTRFVRENRVFPSTGDLVQQIEKDKQHIMGIVKQGETACQ